MGGLGAYYQATSLGLSEGAATSAMLQAQNREREGREQEAKTQKLLEEQNKLLRDQQNTAKATADAQQSAVGRADRERQAAIAAEKEEERKAQRHEQWAEEKAEKDRRAQIAKDLFASLEKLFESTKAQHPDFEEASGSLQDLAALNTSRDDSGSAINADLWVKAWQLEKLIELIEPLEDSLSEADQLEKFNTLKEKIPVFISSHAELGTIPAKPLAVLKREQSKLTCITKLNQWSIAATCGACKPDVYSSLKIEYYWCPQSGYHHALELVCPDEDLADADWCAQKFEEEKESLKSDHNYGDEYDKYLGYFLPKNRPEKGREFAALSAGGWHSLGLGPTGRVYGWGRDRRGQASPSGSIAAQAIAAGDWHGLALKNDGSVVGWGHNEHGQATPPEGLQGGLALAAGEYHSLALLNNGTVVGWGNNDHGQITPPEGLGGAIAIAAGESHSLALLSNGTVVGWGNNSLGQAQPPENLQGVVALAAGGSHSLALLSNGTVIGWGSNSEGQAQPPAGLQGVTAIAGGGYHSLALLSNGTVVGWGNNDYGQAMPPETGSVPESDLPPVLEPVTTPGIPPAISRPSPQPNLNITAISAGKFFSGALQQNGNFTSWGYDITKRGPLQAMPGLTAFGGYWHKSKWVIPHLHSIPMPCSSRIVTTLPRIPDPTNITLQFLEEVHKIRVGDPLPDDPPPHFGGLDYHRSSALNSEEKSVLWTRYTLGVPNYCAAGLKRYAINLKEGKFEEAENDLLPLHYFYENIVEGRKAADTLLQIANRRLQGADVPVSAKEWIEERPCRHKMIAMYLENFWKDLPPDFRRKLEELESGLKDTSGSEGDADNPLPEKDCPGVELMRTYRWLVEILDKDRINEEKRWLVEILEKGRMRREESDDPGGYEKWEDFFTRLDVARDKAELSKRQAKKMGAVAFILINQAMWNFDGVSQSEYQLIIDMAKDWDRRLGMKLKETDITNLVQWAINKCNEDAHNQNRDNYEAIVGNLHLFNRFERPIVPAQLHKVGDLDGGITAEQLQFIHDIEAYLNTEGLVAEEDESLVNADQAICYILLVMALWDDDGFTEQEQGAVAEIMGNFSVGLPLETLTVMLEENVEHYQRDDANKDIKHLENCMEQATSQLSDTWKQWLIESLQHLAEVGGTTDQQQKGFMKLLPKQLGLEKEPEKAAA